MNVAQIAGWSGAGKTMLIAGLIRIFTAQGLLVGAIKHTHHPLNDDRIGDTAQFLDAGASLVMLAGDGEAIVAGERVRFAAPPELLAYFASCDIVLVEGFKQFRGWPRIEVSREERRDAADVAVILDRIWRSSAE
ncbi:MAG TPA: molybdopterin-guanine dinucleotide biosynthesis protein B [Thermoanaerobaculia bacterium]|nr:molybdopterin-guanine dinucleotide biosynthesis protein B [Thermoanaerobaculia bacterium]